MKFQTLCRWRYRRHSLRYAPLFIPYLPPFRIHMVSVPVDELGNGYDLISLAFQIGDQGIQGVCGIFCPVMAEDDGAVAKMLVAAYRTDNGVRSIILPVERIHIPLNGIISALGSRADYVVVVVSVGGTKQEHIVSGELLHLLMNLHQLLFLSLVGQLAHIFMIFAVIAQVMACGKDGFHILRIAFYPLR